MKKDDLIRALNNKIDGAPLEMACRLCLAEQDGSFLGVLLKALVREGVPGLGARLLRSLPDLRKKHPEYTALIAKLEALVPGAVPGEEMQAHFERLKRMLLSSRPHLKGIEPELDRAGVDSSVVFRTEGGYAILIEAPPEGGLSWCLPEIAGPDASVQFIADDGRNTTSLLMLGVPRLDVWQRAMAWTAESGFAPPIDLIELDLGVLGKWLRLLDDPSVFEGRRIGVFAGPQAMEQYEAALRADPTRMLPSQILKSGRLSPPLPDLPVALVESIVAARRDSTLEMIQRQGTIHDGRTATEWGDRFRKAGIVEPPLRVVGLTTRHSSVMQYSMRDLAGAFGRAGCDFEILAEPHAFTSTIETAREIAERECDLVVVINHGRHELDGEIHEKIPFVCWIQDHMPALWNPKAGRSVGEFDLVLGQSRSLMTGQFDYPGDRFLETSNLTDPEMYSDAPLDDAALQAARCDVSFVSHGSAPPAELLESMTTDESGEVIECLTRVNELIEEALGERPFIRSLDLAALLLKAERETSGTAFTPEIRMSVLLQKSLALYDRHLRHETLRWAAGWAESRGRELRIYGRGWERHPEFRRYASGVVENGPDLRAVCQASRINLQVNAYGSMHQRLLDGLASGGCMLVRFNPADTLRREYEILRDIIYRDRLTLDSIQDRRRSDAELDRTLFAIERLEGTHIAPMSDPLRQCQAQLQEAVFNLPARRNDDAGLFRRLCTLEQFPRRIAGDLPGYESCVFETEAKLNELLDHLVDDEAARKRLGEPMRRAVLEHDTYDALVKRILDHFRGLGLETHVSRPEALSIQGSRCVV